MNRSYFSALSALSSFALLFACSATGGESDLDDGGTGATGGTIDSGSGGSVGSGGLAGTGSVAGTGGLEGTGGEASTGGALGSGGTTPGGSGCAGADILCETFDAATVGAKPSGVPWEADACTGSSYIAEVQAAVGLNSSPGYFSQAPGSASENTCALQYALGSDLNDFWVTAHIKITGGNPAGEHEVTFLELGEVPGDDPELRIGYRGDSSCNNSGNVYPGFELGATKGPGGEFTGCTGTVPVAETWYCLEVHVVQDAASMTADMFIDGANQDYLVHSQPHDEVEGLFRANYLKVGMQSYSGNFGGLIIDDLSVSTTQVGCQ